ncbi:hypothetical protein JST56_07065 [Candidatus Dependentiae bacterium]|nr:hypothetical protein [Candidatus Dependentiae bacterium]
MNTVTFINDGIIPLLTKHIDWVSVLLVLCSGFFVKRYTPGTSIIPIGKKVISIASAGKTLIIGSLFITLYIIVMWMGGELHREDYTKYLISYCVATSLYEIIVKPFMKVLGLNKKDE